MIERLHFRLSQLPLRARRGVNADRTALGDAVCTCTGQRAPAPAASVS